MENVFKVSTILQFHYKNTTTVRVPNFRTPRQQIDQVEMFQFLHVPASQQLLFHGCPLFHPSPRPRPRTAVVIHILRFWLKALDFLHHYVLDCTRAFDCGSSSARRLRFFGLLGKGRAVDGWRSMFSNGGHMFILDI